MCTPILYYDDLMLEVPDFVFFAEGNSEAEEGSEFANHNLITSSTNKQWQDIFDDILKGNDNPEGNFQQHVVNWQKNNPGDSDTSNGRIGQMGNFLTEKIAKKWKEWNKNEIDLNAFSISEATSDARNAIPEMPDNIQAYKLNGVDHKANPHALSQHSKGCRWFFSFLVKTEFAKNRQQNTLFLLDEPAANLHRSGQSGLVGCLKELCNKESSTSVIYSTHSEHTLSDEIIPNIWVAHNRRQKEQGNTDISCRSIKDEEVIIHGENIHPIIAFLRSSMLNRAKEGTDAMKNYLTWMKKELPKKVVEAATIQEIMKLFSSLLP